MNRHFLLAAAIGCGLVVSGCASAPGEKQNWNLFSAWKVDTRTKKESAAGEKSTTTAATKAAPEAVCLASAADLERAGHLREAAVLLEKARQLNPAAAEIAPRLAGLYERIQDVPAARGEYRRALAAAPQNAELLNAYGYFEFRQAQFADAEQAFRQALAVTPQHALARLNLAQTLANAGRLSEAYDQFAQLQGPVAAHVSVGTILAGQGRVEEARGAFAQALALNPQEPAAMAFMARTTPLPSKVIQAAAEFPSTGPLTTPLAR